MSNFILLKQFDDPIQARLFIAKLENEGIQCIIENENLIAMDPLLSNAIGGINIKIHKADYSNAKEIIHLLENSTMTNDEDEIIKCPNCNSDKLFIGQKSMKGVIGILSALLSILFLVYSIFYETRKKCKSCGNEF